MANNDFPWQFKTAANLLKTITEVELYKYIKPPSVFFLLRNRSLGVSSVSIKYSFEGTVSDSTVQP